MLHVWCINVDYHPDQCALDLTGQLMDAKDITWYNDSDDQQLIASASGGTGTQGDVHYSLLLVEF